MYVLMDMGTTNTRLWLCQGEVVLGEKKGSFGAKYSMTHGKDGLLAAVAGLLHSLLVEQNALEEDLECVLASGMAGSEMGLSDVPHLSLPATAETLAKSPAVLSLPEICPAPFYIVPGLKQVENGQTVDILRGEETELVGLLPYLPKNTPVALLLPGTHNKLLLLDENGTLTHFLTTLSGELLDTVLLHTVLQGQVSHDFLLRADALRAGDVAARKDGLGAALFRIRVMGRNGESVDTLSSFLYGAVLGQDTAPILRLTKGRPLYVGGREALQKAYSLLLGPTARPVPKEAASAAVRKGLMTLKAMLPC